MLRLPWLQIVLFVDHFIFWANISLTIIKAEALTINVSAGTQYFHL